MGEDVAREDSSTVDEGVPARRAVVAGAIGQGLEIFDFAIYGFMAVTISTLFFPQGNPTAALVGTFAIFSVGFIARPIGGLFLGNLGDKIGRKNALALVIAGMALATCAIGLLPTYEQTGIFASILLFVARFAQGFVAGGDYGNSSAFLVEYAPDSRRGFYGSWQQFAVVAGALAASGLTAIITNSVSEEALAAWVWRLPFILALLPGLFGLYLRLSIQDSPKFRQLLEDEGASESPIRDSLRGYWKPILITGGIFLFWSVSQQAAFTYHIAHVTTTAELALPTALSANTLALIIFAILTPLTGLLSDRVGRKPLLIAACLGFIFFSYPTYLLMGQGTFLTFFLAQSTFGIFLALMSGPAPAALAELFPTKVRVVSVTIGAMVALSVFGAPTPALSTWLVGTTGSASAPAFWLMGTAVVTLAVILFAMKEGTGKPLQ